MNTAAEQVLLRYPPETRGMLTPIASGDHFSGAAIWKVEGRLGGFCLKAWPDLAPERLAWIHERMRQARQAGLAYAPEVVATRDGTTWTTAANRLWDLTTWMPGQPEGERASSIRLAAACAALARLHVAWTRDDSSVAPCQAVERRLTLLADWSRLVNSGWRPAFAADDAVDATARQAWEWLAQHAETVPRLLADWRDRPMPLQPCLCDVWRPHVLFTQDEVTGLIDYGSARIDHPAGDLARLLGSLAGDDVALRQAALRAYRTVRPLSLIEEGLVEVLDRTGTILSAANWLMWLYGPESASSARSAFGRQQRGEAGRRLAELCGRLAAW